MSDGFYLNAVEDRYYIETSGITDEAQLTGETAKWAELAAGISTVDTDDSDDSSSESYYDGDGTSTTDITGITTGYSFSGKRYKGDAAQDFVAKMRFQTGNGRIAGMKHVDADGNGEVGMATWQDISVTGGDANDKGNFSVTAHYRGKPATVTAGA